jgi:hypothetical protein
MKISPLKNWRRDFAAIHYSVAKEVNARSQLELFQDSKVFLAT